MNVKQENFKRISDNRTKKIIDLVSKLHNLNNPSFYEYTPEEIRNIFESIQNEIDKQKKYLKELFKKEVKKEKL